MIIVIDLAVKGPDGEVDAGEYRKMAGGLEDDSVEVISMSSGGEPLLKNYMR